MSGPSQTAAQRSALRWTSRDSRSSRPAGGGAREQQLGRRRDRRPGERFGADDAARTRLDQRLEKNVDLLVRDRRFEQQVTPWGGGRRLPLYPTPAVPTY